jgi:hypothetical protein
MRLPRLRFTTRWMAVVVAIVAVLLFAVVQLDRYWKLGISYKQRAADLRSEEAYTRRNIQRTEVVIADIRARLERADGKGGLRLRSLLDEQRDQMAQHAKYAHYLTELRSKYERAAVSPWLPVEPDMSPP